MHLKCVSWDHLWSHFVPDRVSDFMNYMHHLLLHIHKAQKVFKFLHFICYIHVELYYIILLYIKYILYLLSYELNFHYLFWYLASKIYDVSYDLFYLNNVIFSMYFTYPNFVLHRHIHIIRIWIKMDYTFIYYLHLFTYVYMFIQYV